MGVGINRGLKNIVKAMTREAGICGDVGKMETLFSTMLLSHLLLYAMKKSEEEIKEDWCFYLIDFRRSLMSLMKAWKVIQGSYPIAESKFPDFSLTGSQEYPLSLTPITKRSKGYGA